MSCTCENKKRSSDLDHVRKLAKDLAILEQKTVVIIKNSNDTYGFCTYKENINRPIVEYITQY